MVFRCYCFSTKLELSIIQLMPRLLMEVCVGTGTSAHPPRAQYDLVELRHDGEVRDPTLFVYFAVLICRHGTFAPF